MRYRYRSKYKSLSILLAVAMAVLLLPTSSKAASNEVPNLVQQGIKAFEAKQYEEAIHVFEAALKKEPKDPRVLFNLGCVKSAQGKYDEAIKLLEDASMTDDTQLALKCRYNLGQIAVDRAKAALGEKPEDVDEATRTKVMEFVDLAMTDYSTCLEMDSNYDDARHNLELLRVWQKNMQKTWKEKDRQARRKSMDLKKFVDWMDKEQRSLREQGDDLQKQRRTPKRRLALQDTSKEQRELSEEIDPLKQKISDMLTAQATGPQGPGLSGAGGPGKMTPSAQPGMMPQMPQAQQQPAISPEQREKITKVLQKLAENAGESMTTASQYLNERMFNDASKSQGKSIEQIDQIGAIITPYPELVHKAVGEQRQLTTQTQKKETSDQTTTMDQSLIQAQRTTADGRPEPMREFVEAIENQGDLSSATSAINATPIAPNVSRTDVDEQPTMGEATPEPLDPTEVAWQQRFVERWSQLLIGKAEEGLKNLPPEEKSVEKPKPDEKTTPEEPKQLSPEEQAAKAKKEKIEGLRESMRRAVKLGPKVVRLTNKAARLLDDNEVDAAVPNQQEALELLEKIAEPLKDKNQQDQDKDKNQDQKDNKDKKDQDKGQDKNGPPPTPKPQPPKPQPSKPQPQKPKQGNGDKKQPMPIPKRQAEILIRKVKERQREAEKVRVMLLEKSKSYGPHKVDKDW